MRRLALLLAMLLVPIPTLAQNDGASSPLDVTYCGLSGDPAAYNHKEIRVTAFAAHGFENFSLTDPTCKTQGFSIWVMYGGKAQSDTVYCCPGESGAAERSEPLEIEGRRIPLVQDVTFRQFTKLIKQEPDTTVHLTAVGTFFSGEKQTINGHTFWGGAGHKGCCSLFVIQQVESVQPHIRKDLDYTAEAGYYEKERCGGGTHHIQNITVSYPNDATVQVIEEQKKAERGKIAWVFTDPQRVAEETLKVAYPGEVPSLQIVKKTDARRVYRWERGKNDVVVVVTRPYWLSFYANSDSVAWVTTTIKQATCN